MALQYDIVYTFTGSDGTVAKIGPPALIFSDPAYVGIPDEDGIAGLDVAEIRKVTDNIVSGHGGVHGPWFYGPHPFSFTIIVDPNLGTAVNARMELFKRATDCMDADGKVEWTETGRPMTMLSYRREQYRETGRRPKKILMGGVAAQARVLATAESGPASSPVTVGGQAPTYPIITLTPSGFWVLLTRGSETLALAVGGANGLTSGQQAVVDFGARTITQGGVNKNGAIAPQFGAKWWAFRPGVNGWSGGGTAKWRDAW